MQMVVPVVTRWWQALNPAIYLVSILPGLTVWWLADKTHSVNASLLLATTGVVLLQHAINLFNDAKDWRLGADPEKGDSWVRVHNNDPRVANIHGVISLLGGSALGLLSLSDERLWILWYAMPFVILGLFYNFGRKPLSYTTAGEWITGICYGPGVFGSLWLVAGQPFNETAIAGMLAFAALSMSLLFSHQPPQIETDRAAGKHSFAVRHGAKRTYQASSILFSLALFFLSIATWSELQDFALALPFFFAAVISMRTTINMHASPKRILIYASLVFVAAVPISMLVK